MTNRHVLSQNNSGVGSIGRRRAYEDFHRIAIYERSFNLIIQVSRRLSELSALSVSEADLILMMKQVRSLSQYALLANSLTNHLTINSNELTPSRVDG